MNKKQLVVAWGIIFLMNSICFAKEEMTLELINGVTTQQQVIKVFRKPDEVTKDKTGNEVWVFKDAIKIDNVDSGKEYQNYLLELTFNKNGILINSDIKPAGSGH